MRKLALFTAAAATLLAMPASADDLKIALIYGKTGPLEAYAKQTENGLRMGLEYATKNTMTVDGRKIGKGRLLLVRKTDRRNTEVRQPYHRCRPG